MKKIIFFISLMVFLSAWDKYEYTENDKDIFYEKFNMIIMENSFETDNEKFLFTAKSFLETPYKASTLESDDKEKVKINLSGLDCYTFIENSLAFSELKNKQNSIEEYLKSVESLRYRNGQLGDYTERLHYFIDWKYEQEKNGVLKDITKEIGGENYAKQINFMSEKNHYYPKLKDNPENIEKIKKIENSINQRKQYYIPQNNIVDIENKLNEGDIVGITTSIKGLDVSHMGIVVKSGNSTHLLHASSTYKKVVISEKSLSQYILSNKNQSGIIVLRLSE